MSRSGGAPIFPPRIAPRSNVDDLRNGQPEEGTTWRYNLGNRSRDNIGALIRDPSVDDTGYINRDALTAPDGNMRVTLRSFPETLKIRFDRPWQYLELLPSVWLLAAGLLLLQAARASDERRRRNVTVATLLFVGVLALAFPISPLLVTMGDANQAVQNRRDFET